jgi:hypothetical protein
MLYTLKCEFVDRMQKYVNYFVYGTTKCSLPTELYAMIKLLEWEDDCTDVDIPCNYEKYL